LANQNPYPGDQVLGGAWEEGYLAGYAEPETDHFRPFTPNILNAYTAGEQAGRDDRRHLPPDQGGVPEGAEEEPSVLWESLKDIAKEVGLHALGHKFFEIIFGAVGGLIAIVATVVQIPGDVTLRPMDDDWTGPADAPEDTYVAVCPRNDHGPAVGATAEGYWIGPAHQFFADALNDKLQHQHAESAVTRCSGTDGQCGLVWPGSGE